MIILQKILENYNFFHLTVHYLFDNIAKTEKCK
jgi:hypothetical protein